jgi:hypothetical protein
MSTMRGDVKLKMKVNMLEMILEKIKIVLNLKAVSGILYVDLVLRKLKVERDLFILEIEQGIEVFIPNSIS